MGLNANALTTVQAARGRLNDDDADLDKLEGLINGYSLAVKKYTRREFVPTFPDPDTDPAQPRSFFYDGGGYLDLVRYELRTVTSIVMYSDLRPVSSQTILSAGDANTECGWRLEPRPGTDEDTYLALALPIRDVPYGRRNYGIEVTVTGHWGVGYVPGDVEMATLTAVADAWRNPEGFATRSLGELTFSEQADEEGGSLPQASRDLLIPYRRSTII